MNAPLIHVKGKGLVPNPDYVRPSRRVSPVVDAPYVPPSPPDVPPATPFELPKATPAQIADAADREKSSDCGCAGAAEKQTVQAASVTVLLNRPELPPMEERIREGLATPD